MTKARWIGLALGIVMIASAFGVVVWQSGSVANTLTNTAGLALAQSPTATPTAAPKRDGKPDQKGAALDQFLTALAKRLGISVDDLKSKVKDAGKDVIEQAVKDGKLTRAQADQLEQRLDSGQPFGGFFPFKGPFGGFHHQPGQPPAGSRPDMRPGGMFGPFGFGEGLGGFAELEAVAKAVNLAPADLLTQIRGGKSLADIAKAQNVPEATVKQAIVDTANAQIDRAVKDGLLTQDQATKLKANLTPAKIDLSKIHFPGHHPGP